MKEGCAEREAGEVVSGVVEDTDGSSGSLVLEGTFEQVVKELEAQQAWNQ